LASSLLFACGSDPEQKEEPVTPVSSITVSAGEDISVNEQTLVTLTASVSDDSEVRYHWQQIGDNSVVLTGSDSANVSFSSGDISSDEQLVFQVTVSDSQNTHSDKVTVTVKAQIETSNLANYQPTEGPSHKGRNIVSVSSAEQFYDAVTNAKANDVITLAEGEYELKQQLVLNKAGTESQPIFIRAEELGQVKLNFYTGDQSFFVRSPWWIIENLTINGACSDMATGCEHAFHIVGKADHIILRHNHIVDFVTHVKTNGEDLASNDGVNDEFPDDLWFIANKFWRTKISSANKPTNILNLDGGRRNIVRGNIMAEFARAGQGHANGVYPKAGMRDLLVEQNLIVCNKNVVGSNDTAGISLGDGMGSEDWCDGLCFTEGQNQQAIIRNNIIMNCNGPGNSNGFLVLSDVGSKIYHNSVYNVKNNFFRGIEISNTDFTGNILLKGIYDYKQNPFLDQNNFKPASNSDMEPLFSDLKNGDWRLEDGSDFVDQGETNELIKYDFCGYPREESPDLGAIEYGKNSEACLAKIKKWYDSI